MSEDGGCVFALAGAAQRRCVQCPYAAGSLLREGDAPEGAAGSWRGPLPNLRIVARDAAHASRRVTKRPWTADPFLKDVVERTIFAKNSPTRLLQ
eukprot:2061307-Alexandrium_andersonii.AAC.1